MKHRVPLTSYFEWQQAVISIQSAPPISPNEGDRFIISTNPTGIWASYANYIAQYIEAAWEYITPKEGMVVYNLDESDFYLYELTAWHSYRSEIIIPVTTGFTLTDSDLNFSYMTESTTGLDFYLPPITTSTIGKWFRIIKLTAANIYMYPDANDQIHDNAIGERFGNKKNENFANIRIVAVKLGRWIAVDGDGSWG